MPGSDPRIKKLPPARPDHDDGAPSRAPARRPAGDGAPSAKAAHDAVRRASRSHGPSAVAGGSRLQLLVLSCHVEDTTGVDVASGAFVRIRVPWPQGHAPDLSPFDLVEAHLADDPERDDLAQPEAVSVTGLPRQVGTLRGWRARRLLARLVARPDGGPLLGFPGPSAPYWGFRGLRPSVALFHPDRGPQLLRRGTDGSTWARFGLQRDDVWLPVEDLSACRALDVSRQGRLSGKALESALGFAPYYLLTTVSRPRDGHCYKVCAALLPKG